MLLLRRGSAEIKTTPHGKGEGTVFSVSSPAYIVVNNIQSPAKPATVSDFFQPEISGCYFDGITLSLVIWLPPEASNIGKSCSIVSFFFSSPLMSATMRPSCIIIRWLPMQMASAVLCVIIIVIKWSFATISSVIFRNFLAVLGSSAAFHALRYNCRLQVCKSEKP